MILKKFYSKNQRGLSLIEMMVVVVILGFIVLGLVTFFTGGTKSWVAGQSQLTAQQNARQAMDRMVREIRHGDTVLNSQDHRVKVNIPNLTGAGGSKYHVTYSLENGDSVERKTEIGTLSRTILIDVVLNLRFDYPDSGNPKKSWVNILLEVDVDSDGNPDITLHSKAKLRNHGLSD